MHILANFMLLALTTVPATKPAHVDTYAEKFNKQVDSLTVALVDYINTDCTEKDFNKKAVKFREELEEFGNFFKQIPTDEDDVTLYKQIEIGYGINSLADKVITEQNKCVTEHFTHDDIESSR